MGDRSGQDLLQYQSTSGTSYYHYYNRNDYSVGRWPHQDMKYNEALKVESKYRPLDSFSNDPIEDVFVLFAFGRAHFESPSQEERTCYFERAIPYF
jgi:hypothetical protein